MIQSILLIAAIYGVMHYLYVVVTKRRYMEFVYNEKIILSPEIQSMAPTDMIYQGEIQDVKQLPDGKLEIILERLDGTREIAYTPGSNKPTNFPLGNTEYYIGGLYYAILNSINEAKHKSLSSKIVGTDKNRIYLKNKYYYKPYVIHLDHIGYMTDEWVIGKKVKVTIEGKMFHIK